MTYLEIIHEEMRKKSLTSKDVTRLCGYSHDSKAWRIVTGNVHIKIRDFLHVMDCLGYEVVVRPKGKYRTKYKLTEGEEE